MTVSVIAAVAANGVIGKDNDLIWNLPKDMKFFKDTTKGHYVLMGRKNWDSIPKKYRPLPDRTNVVVTRQEKLRLRGAKVVHSIEAGLEIARKKKEEEAFIIGGGMIYADAFKKNLVDKLYLTILDKEYEGDTLFPEIDMEQWNVISEERYEKDEKHETGFTITVLERVD